MTIKMKFMLLPLILFLGFSLTGCALMENNKSKEVVVKDAKEKEASDTQKSMAEKDEELSQAKKNIAEGGKIEKKNEKHIN